MTEREGTIVERPIHLDYTYTAGLAQSRFLKAIAEKRILGERCPVCGKVYVASRGSCPTDGVPTEGEIEIAQRGTVTTFCIVNVPFAGQSVECPYASALILPDGADIALMGLIQEIPYDEVRMGLRVEAVWADEVGPTLQSIKYWKPTGEPDAAYETYREHV